VQDAEVLRRIDARRFPTIDGVLTHVEVGGAADRYRVGGDVTFRGVTRPYEDDIELHFVDDRTVKLEGRSRFDIREFGMKAPRILMLRVEPVVAVRVEILAVRET
jgi:polyisoprenoid-binding protein YceI